MLHESFVAWLKSVRKRFKSQNKPLSERHSFRPVVEGMEVRIVPARNVNIVGGTALTNFAGGSPVIAGNTATFTTAGGSSTTATIGVNNIRTALLTGGIDRVVINNSGGTAGSGNITLTTDLSTNSLTTSDTLELAITGGSFSNTGGNDISGSGSLNVTTSGTTSSVSMGVATINLGSGSLNLSASGTVATSTFIVLGSSVTANGGVSLTSTGGAINIAAFSTVSSTGSVSFNAGGSINIAGLSTVSSGGPLSFTAGDDITIDGSVTGGNSPVTLTAQNDIALNSNLNVGNADVTIKANQDGTGSNGFGVGLLGGDIITTGANTVAITVNTAGGGTGNAFLRNITTASGGAANINTGNFGGDIQSAGFLTQVNVGSGSVSLTGDSIGSSNLTPISVNADTITVTGTQGGADSWVNEASSATFTATTLGDGTINFVAGGAIVMSGATSSGSGDIYIVANGGSTTGSGSITTTGNIALGASSIGTSGDPLDMNGGSISTLTSGDQFLAEADTINIVPYGLGFLTNGLTSTAGAITLASGEFILTNNNQVSDVPVTVATGAIFDLATFNETIGSLAGGGETQIGGGTLTTGATTSDFSGILTGTGNITKNGAGIFTLSGSASNTLSGTFTVNRGSLILNKTSGADAVSGTSLVIGSATFTPIVQLSASQQIKDTTSVQVNANGSLLMNGQTDLIGVLTVAGGTVNTGTNGILMVGGTITHTSGDVIAQQGGYVNATGTWTQSGGNSLLNGAIFDSSGNVLTEGGRFIPGASGFSLTGGVLAGTGGRIQGNITNSGGAIQPGGSNAIGALKVTGNWTQTGGNLEIELSGTNPGTPTSSSLQFDRLFITGVANFGGGLVVTQIAPFTTTPPDYPNSFSIITFGSRASVSTTVPSDFATKTGVGTSAPFGSPTRYLVPTWTLPAASTSLVLNTMPAATATVPSSAIQVSKLGLFRNPSTGRWVYTLGIKNLTGATYNKPVVLVITNVSSGNTLYSSTGTTPASPSVGSIPANAPYIVAYQGPMAAGQTVTLGLLEFYRGAGTPPALTFDVTVIDGLPT